MVFFNPPFSLAKCCLFAILSGSCLVQLGLSLRLYLCAAYMDASNSSNLYISFQVTPLSHSVLLFVVNPYPFLFQTPYSPACSKISSRHFSTRKTKKTLENKHIFVLSVEYLEQKNSALFWKVIFGLGRFHRNLAVFGEYYPNHLS